LGNPSGLQLSKWELIWECEGSFPHTFLHSREHEMWLPASNLARTLASPCLVCEPKVKVATPFLFWLLFSLNNFNYDAKDVSILHLKLGNNGRPTYFPISIPLGHPPPIATIDLLQVIDCWVGKFLTSNLY
jgi:hypothetical protein